MAGLFVRLEVEWVDHPKLIAAGMEGRGVHATAMCLAKRLALATDGWIARVLLTREGATDDMIERAISGELLEVDGEGRVRPWDWCDRNPSQDAIAARSASKSEAASHVHHRKGQQGADAHSPAMLLHVCEPCHRYIHAHPAESIERGWMVSRLGVKG